jgi:glycerophosphoryl diester phosphodiesterase
MKILAHRAGPDGRHPENSVEALEAALRGGADGVEIDVRRDASGRYLVFHDELPRRRPRLSNGERAPELAEFLERAVRGLVFLDVKGLYPPGELLGIARGALEEERIVFGSFFHPWVREVKRACRSVRTAATVAARLVDPAGAARAARADILAIESEFVDAATARSARRAGVELFPWTVNDPAEGRRLASLRVEAIITDFPSRFRYNA